MTLVEMLENNREVKSMTIGGEPYSLRMLQPDEISPDENVPNNDKVAPVIGTLEDGTSLGVVGVLQKSVSTQFGKASPTLILDGYIDGIHAVNMPDGITTIERYGDELESKLHAELNARLTFLKPQALDNMELVGDTDLAAHITKDITMAELVKQNSEQLAGLGVAIPCEGNAVALLKRDSEVKFRKPIKGQSNIVTYTLSAPLPLGEEVPTRFLYREFHNEITGLNTIDNDAVGFFDKASDALFISDEMIGLHEENDMRIISYTTASEVIENLTGKHIEPDIENASELADAVRSIAATTPNFTRLCAENFNDTATQHANAVFSQYVANAKTPQEKQVWAEEAKRLAAQSTKREDKTPTTQNRIVKGKDGGIDR